MLSSVKENLTFTPLSQEEKESRGILGRLAGPIASCVVPTRNGRKYTDSLWEKAFDEPIVKEMFRNGGLPGELNHPDDRSETDATKIAIMMPQPPVKNKDGELVACVDILDTPCGRIAYQLAKYGFQFGISSRGEGDIIEDSDGEEVVDEETYILNAFDLVLLPAVETARLKMVESLDTKKTLKEVLNEAIKSSSEEDQKIMIETLDSLDVGFKEENNEDKNNSVNEEESEDTENIANESEINEDNSMAASDNGAEEIIQELKESLKTQQELEQKVKTLQEKLSVCYTKEARYEDAIDKFKNNIKQLISEKQSLEEKLSIADNTTCDSSIIIAKQEQIIKSIRKRLEDASKDNISLNECLKSKSSEIKKHEDGSKALKERYESVITRKNEEISKLNESIAESKKDLSILRNQNNIKLENSNKLVEKYKLIAKTAVNKYINLQASRLGISTEDIQGRLKENYSFSDVDKVCESLQKYKLKVNTLPFGISNNERPVKLNVKESQENTNKNNSNYRIDDEVDSTLTNFIT